MSKCRDCLRYATCELPSRGICDPAEDCIYVIPPRRYLGKPVRRFMTDDEIDALNRLRGQMNDGYIDIGEIHDRDEFDLVARALSEYEQNHKGETK